MSLIKGITSDHELIELSKKLNIKLDGVYSIQEITKPLPKTGSYIILLRSDGVVGHWVAQYQSNYFDSMGIGNHEILGQLKCNDIQYQGTYDEYCGVWALLFLYSKQRNRPELLKGFTDLDIDII